MVSSGTVNESLSSITSIFNEYSSCLSDLDSMWKGQSHDNLISKANSFVSEYLSTVESEMNSLAQACSLYSDYKNNKNSLEVANNNYNLAVSNNDEIEKSKYGSLVSEYESKLNSLKSEIISLLESASSTALEGAKGEFVNYYQYNYSNPYYDGTTISDAGCGPTSMAMVLTYLTGKEVTPVETTNYSLEHGTYVVDEGTDWSYFPMIAEDYGISCEESAVSSENIINSLSEGNTIIMSMGPGTFTKTGHFIVLTGINEDGTISVADPNSEERSNTTYDVSTFVNEGSEMWSFNE